MAEPKRQRTVGDAFYEAQRQGGEATNFLRNPIQVIQQWGRQRLQQVGECLKNRDLPGGGQSQKSGTSSSINSVEQSTVTQTTATAVLVREAPESSIVTSHPVIPDVDQDGSGSLPIWDQGNPLKGSRWDRYTVGECLEQGDGFRLFAGRKSNDEPVLIKEYLLRDRGFEYEEITERQQAFERLVNLNLKIGNGPDFRVVKLIDAFLSTRNSRCYLITKPIVDHGTQLNRYSATLEAYLADRKVLPAVQIREILRQVLETLRFLHTYRVRFSTEQTEQGIPHGNIRLTSLRLRQTGIRGVTPERQFFIYVTDLALWEHPFYPPGSPQFHEQVADTASDLVSIASDSHGEINWKRRDLKDLGLVAFRLAGATFDPRSGQPELQLKHPLPELEDEPLAGFMQQLIGLKPPFKTAEEALHALLQLKPPHSIEMSAPDLAEEPPKDKTSAKNLLLPVALILLLFVGLGTIPLALLHLNQPKSDSPKASSSKATAVVQQIPGVKNVPPSIRYLVEPDGAWDFALQRTFVLPGRSENNLNLIRYIEQRYGNLRLKNCAIADVQSKSNLEEPSGNLSPNQCIVQLDPGGNFLSRLELLLTGSSRDLAILTQLPKTIPKTLDKKPVAYDALVVFTQFRDAYGSEAVIQKLGGYAISLDELKRLYTGDTDTPELRNGQTVKLFFPNRQTDGDYAVRLFENLVLNNNPALIKKFRALEDVIRNREQTANLSTQRKDIYARITSANEVGIGFDRLGRMFNQCSVYPLAIGEKSQAVQVLVQANGKPIDDKTDLCSTKGSYWFDVSRYPLKYELGVVFRKDSEAGAKLAEILTTTEGQYLMSEVGLVPQSPVQELGRSVWKQNP